MSDSSRAQLPSEQIVHARRWSPDCGRLSRSACVSAREPAALAPLAETRCKRCRGSSIRQTPSSRLEIPEAGASDDKVKLECGHVDTMMPAMERQRMEAIRNRKVAPPTRIERATLPLGGGCSIH